MADNVTLPGSGAVIATDEVVDGTLGTVQVQYTKLMDGTLGSTNKAVVNSAGSLNVVDPDTTATGSLTSTTSVTLTGQGGCSTAFVQITGTWVGTVVLEGTVDGTNFFGINGVVPTTGVIVASATANGAWTIDIAGLNQFRVRCSVFTSGTIVVTIRGSVGGALVSLDNALPTGANVIGALTANQSINNAQWGGTNTVNGGVAGTVAVGGVTAAAATSTGNPVRIGAIGRTTNPTAVTDGQVANVMTDKMGRLVVVNQHHRNLVSSQATTITSSVTATTIIAAGGASVFRDISHLSITNGSATATTVTLLGATGNFIWNVPAGGGFMQNFDPPLPATTANTAWTITCGTSVASVYVNTVFVGNL